MIRCKKCKGISFVKIDEVQKRTFANGSVSPNIDWIFDESKVKSHSFIDDPPLKKGKWECAGCGIKLTKEKLEDVEGSKES